MAKRNHKPESLSAKEKFPYHRNLKVRKGYYDYQPQEDHVMWRGPRPPVPFILIKGFWLNAAGFQIDTSLQVTIRRNRIVIIPSPT